MAIEWPLPSGSGFYFGWKSEGKIAGLASDENAVMDFPVVISELP
jgi:hypothetical protein